MTLRTLQVGLPRLSRRGRHFGFGSEDPVIQEIKDKMLEYGAVGSLMSGSGPTVFGLFTNPKAAQDAYEELRFGKSAELAKQVYLTNFYNQKEKNHG